MKACKEFEEIGYFLQEVAEFWHGHHEQISGHVSQGAPQVFSEHEFRSTGEIWECYLPLLQEGIKSITLSSDMILVDAVGPNRGTSKMSALKGQSHRLAIISASTARRWARALHLIRRRR